MARLKTETVTLFERVETGRDPFDAPIYGETAVDVEGVLICPVSVEDIVTDLQLYGKRAEYELCIPKTDTHNWENCTVDFWGQRWQTFGIPQKWMEANVPGPWNGKVKVERYG